MSRLHIAILGTLLLSWGVELLHADTGQDGWLRYAALQSAGRAKYESLPAEVVALGNSVVLRTAQEEMIRGFRGMMGRTLRAEKEVHERAIVLGTLSAIRGAVAGLESPKLEADAFWLATAHIQ